MLAKRDIVMGRRRKAEERARDGFRMLYPPRFLCDACGSTFGLLSHLTHHMKSGQCVAISEDAGEATEEEVGFERSFVMPGPHRAEGGWDV